jgi:hypothetical protein
MKVKIFLILCALVLIIAPISAIDTTVTINTIPNYDLQIAFLVPDTAYGLLGDGLIHSSSDSNGVSTLVLKTSREDFEVKIWLKKDGENILIKRYDDVYDSGTSLALDLYPEWYDAPVKEPVVEINETVNETTNETVNETVDPIIEEEVVPEVEAVTTEETQDTPIEEVKAEKERVTAFSIQDGKFSIAPKGFLYILGLVILAVLVFLGIKHSHHVEKTVRSLKEGKKGKNKEIKIKKMSEMNKKKSSKLKDQEEKINKAKKMIEDAQDEINKMKNPNQSKIDEIKRRLVEDEKELMKLRKEAD